MADIPAPDIPEFLKRFKLLPNEHKGLSFETAFRNGSRESDDRERLYWHPLSATGSHAILEALPGSTIRATVSLLDMECEFHTVFAIGATAETLLDAPSGATIRVRVETVYETVQSEETLYCHPSDRRYDEIQGLLIDEILSIEVPPNN